MRISKIFDTYPAYEQVITSVQPKSCSSRRTANKIDLNRNQDRFVYSSNSIRRAVSVEQCQSNNAEAACH